MMKTMKMWSKKTTPDVAPDNISSADRRLVVVGVTYAGLPDVKRQELVSRFLSNKLNKNIFFDEKIYYGSPIGGEDITMPVISFSLDEDDDLSEVVNKLDRASWSCNLRIVTIVEQQYGKPCIVDAIINAWYQLKNSHFTTTFVWSRRDLETWDKKSMRQYENVYY